MTIFALEFYWFIEFSLIPEIFNDLYFLESSDLRKILWFLMDFIFRFVVWVLIFYEDKKNDELNCLFLLGK